MVTLSAVYTDLRQTDCTNNCYYYHISHRSGSKGRGRGPPPSKNSAPPPVPRPIKFMIKHNLPLVRGGSLWQYRSVPPSCNYGHPSGPPNVNPRTATDQPTSRLCIYPGLLVCLSVCLSVCLPACMWPKVLQAVDIFSFFWRTGLRRAVWILIPVFLFFSISNTWKQHCFTVIHQVAAQKCWWHQ